MSEHAEIKDEHRKIAAHAFKQLNIDSEQESVWIERVAQLIADGEPEALKSDELKILRLLIERRGESGA